ncbi:MAG TPA: hypothetical protein VL946_01940, partial [Lacibacter sp.]|nr:hypothetical protein [Lacibacter sp.]
RVGTAPNTRNDVLISAYRNGAKKVVVAINWGVYNVKQKISFQNAPAATVVPYVTTSSKNVEQGTAISLTNNEFEFTLPPGSIVTFVEQ